MVEAVFAMPEFQIGMKRKVEPEVAVILGNLRLCPMIRPVRQFQGRFDAGWKIASFSLTLTLSLWKGA
jgi:hypothetical protein